MERLAAHIEFVKSQIEFQERQGKRFANEPRRLALHNGTAERFRALLADLQEIQNTLEKRPDVLQASIQAGAKPRLSLSWEEIEGLPPELLSELSVSDSDRAEFNIMAAIRDLGGITSLDRLIVALYRQTGEVSKRLQLNQRLYRMAQKELIYSVPGKKGVYANRQYTEEEASGLN